MNSAPKLCETCRYSMGINLVTAQSLLATGHERGMGDFRGGIGLVCEYRRIVGPTPCLRYEREAGSDD